MTPVHEALPVELLNKIKTTRLVLQQDIVKAHSDAEMLYHLSDCELLNQFESLLHENDEEKIKSEFKRLLAIRWNSIKRTPESYCAYPKGTLNQLCLSIALYIEPLPDDLSVCDNWLEGQGPYFILMPDLIACKDIVLLSNIHQYHFQEFILSEDNTRYIPIAETLRYFF